MSFSSSLHKSGFNVTGQLVRSNAYFVTVQNLRNFVIFIVQFLLLKIVLRLLKVVSSQQACHFVYCGNFTLDLCKRVNGNHSCILARPSPGQRYHQSWSELVKLKLSRPPFTPRDVSEPEEIDAFR